MENKIESLHHISLKSTPEKFPQVLHFYKDILGLEVFCQWSNGVLLKTGDSYLEIFSNAETELSDGNIRHFALCVADVDQWAKKVAAEGFEVFMGPKDICFDSNPQFKARVAFCKGPLGESVEFFCENKFVVREKSTIEERIENLVFAREYCGILQQNIKASRKIYLFCIIMGLIITGIGVSIHGTLSTILGSAYTLITVLLFIFAKEEYIRRFTKNYKKNIETAQNHTGVKMNFEDTTEIAFKYNSIEVKDISGKNSVFALKDFVRIIDHETKYILEFTEGRMVFIKKENFENREQLLALINPNTPPAAPAI